MEWVVATTNRGKFLEVVQGLAGFPLEFTFLGDLPHHPRIEEDQPTFQGNALKKAHAVVEWLGKTALADDSGLIVPALGGRPGIHSARFAGADATDAENRGKLLEEMRSIPEGGRSAFFICVLALVTPEGKEIVVEGRVDGEITRKPRGSLELGGFGYDPLFYLPHLDKTFAELSPEEKNRLSHRGIALQKLKDKLREVG